MRHHDMARGRSRSRWSQRIWLAGGLTVAAVVVLWMGSLMVDEFTAREVTLEEYAEIVCDSDGLPRKATWGEAQSAMQDRLSTYKGLKPPDEIVPFHEGRIAAMEGVIEVVKGKDSGAVMNEYELAFVPEMHQAMRADKAGVRSLSVEHQRLLKKHGCRF